MIIIHDNASLEAWEDTSVKPNCQAKKGFRHLLSSLLFLCVVLFSSLFCLSIECPRTCSLSAESVPTPTLYPVNQVVIFIGKNTWHNERSLSPSICGSSSISGNAQRPWHSLTTEIQEELFPEKAFSYFSQKQQQKLHLDYVVSAKWKVLSCSITFSSKTGLLPLLKDSCEGFAEHFQFTRWSAAVPQGFRAACLDEVIDGCSCLIFSRQIQGHFNWNHIVIWRQPRARADTWTTLPYFIWIQYQPAHGYWAPSTCLQKGWWQTTLQYLVWRRRNYTTTLLGLLAVS